MWKILKKFQADDTEDGFHSDDEWTPELYPYQQQGANVLFFTFINPDTMEVPKSFEKLAKTRGSMAEGAVPADTLILFAIGGYSYRWEGRILREIRWWLRFWHFQYWLQPLALANLQRGCRGHGS